MFKKLSSIGVLCMASLLAHGSIINFSYCHPGDATAMFGTNKPDTYDVAIKISDPMFVGSTVKDIRVELPVSTESIENLSAWVSTELTIENKTNVPNVAQTEATLTDGVLSASFASCPQIPAEGLYVGYSFTTTSRGGASDTPVTVVASTEYSETGLWLHTKKSYSKWTNIAQAKGYVSAMTVTLGTEYGDYEVAISLPTDTYASCSADDNKILTIIVNLGNKEITHFDYTYNIGDNEGSGTFAHDTPLLPGGGRATIDLPVNLNAAEGDYSFSASIDRCDGVDNPNPHHQSSSTMHVWPFIPVKRVLIEEYTGLGCGYCPEGYVIMEEMHKRYGDIMVGAAFHSKTFESGSMVTVDNKDFPNTPDGYPYVYINRANGMEISKLPNAIPAHLSGIVPVSVDAVLTNNDEKASYEITISFAKATNGNDYRLEAILVADGLKNDSWRQTNYFSGLSDPESIESDLWEIFLNGDKQVKGLTFNDVVVYYKEETRNIDCFPAEINSGDAFEYNIEIPFDAILNVRKQQILNDGCELRLAAIVIDNQSGEAINCNISNPLVFTASGIEVLPNDSEIVKTTYTSIDGLSSTHIPTQGLYLRTDYYKDGSIHTTKIIITK